MKSAYEILTSHSKFHINLGLERISRILEILDNPQEKYEIIHIAGTNGKGSSAKIINEILIEHFKNKKKIGLFTSPHLFSYCERIRVNNELISENVFNRLIYEIDELAKKNNIELSEFELICAAAFYYFYIKGVDYVVLEVGLGGAFDATNVVKKSTSVITEIDFDHKERLGSTIDEIAAQKAGIIKENSNVVVYPENKGYKIIKKIADEKKAKIITPLPVRVEFQDRNYAIINNKKYPFNLLGIHQAKNLSLALGAIDALKLKIEDETLKNALNGVRWDFRLEYFKEKNILIDASHNPSGALSLREFIDCNFKDEPKSFIFGCLKNKEYEKMLDILIKPQDKFYFYEFDYPNALKYEELQGKYSAQKIFDISEIEGIIEKDKNLKIFCGSIYMLGKIFSKIKLK